jgi:hypothetical protein
MTLADLLPLGLFVQVVLYYVHVNKFDDDLYDADFFYYILLLFDGQLRFPTEREKKDDIIIIPAEL